VCLISGLYAGVVTDKVYGKDPNVGYVRIYNFPVGSGFYYFKIDLSSVIKKVVEGVVVVYGNKFYPVVGVKEEGRVSAPVGVVPPQPMPVRRDVEGGGEESGEEEKPEGVVQKPRPAPPAPGIVKTILGHSQVSKIVNEFVVFSRKNFPEHINTDLKSYEGNLHFVRSFVFFVGIYHMGNYQRVVVDEQSGVVRLDSVEKRMSGVEDIDEIFESIFEICLLQAGHQAVGGGPPIGRVPPVGVGGGVLISEKQVDVEQGENT